MTFTMVRLDIKGHKIITIERYTHTHTKRRHTLDMEVRISARKKSEKVIACTQQTKTSCKET